MVMRMNGCAVPRVVTLLFPESDGKPLGNTKVLTLNRIGP